MNLAEISELHPVLLRLGVAALLGAILGIDRDLHHKPAGMRVLAMVSLGAALAILASVTAIPGFDGVNPDGATRTVQGIIGGIGFLGAGVIMRSDKAEQVHGLTTASAIWVAAGLGITSGLGQWSVTGTAFVLALIILIVGRRIEQWLQAWSRAREKRRDAAAK